MKNNIPTSDIKTNFNRNEVFTISNVPKDFDSVSKEALSKLSSSIIDKIEADTNLDPNAIEMAFRSVDGQFEPAYITLEDDYAVRKGKLQTAYTQGLSNLRKAYKNFELQVEEHNIAFRKYSAAAKTLNGAPISEGLEYSQNELKKIKETISNF